MTRKRASVLSSLVRRERRGGCRLAVDTHPTLAVIRWVPEHST